MNIPKLPEHCNRCPMKTKDGMCKDLEGKKKCKYSVPRGDEEQ